MLGYAMHNGASVSDWLGTAASAAQGCVNKLSAMRRDENLFTETRIRQAADDAAQALSEVVAVMDRLDMPHGYDSCSFGEEA